MCTFVRGGGGFWLIYYNIFGDYYVHCINSVCCFWILFQTDGKMLCYLCTLTFKRVLAKTKKIDWTEVSSQNNTPQSNPDVSVTEAPTHKYHRYVSMEGGSR